MSKTITTEALIKITQMYAGLFVTQFIPKLIYNFISAMKDSERDRPLCEIPQFKTLQSEVVAEYYKQCLLENSGITNQADFERCKTAILSRHPPEGPFNLFCKFTGRDTLARLSLYLKGESECHKTD